MSPTASSRRAVAALCFCQTILSLGLGLSFPFFAVYLHSERGMPMLSVGAWLSISVLATAVGQGIGGELSDRIGRRRVMVLSLWLRTATVAGLAAAIKGDWGIPEIVGFHLVSSFVAHFFEPAARGWVADHAGIKDRHRAYGWLRTSTHGGFAAGPALGGLIAGKSYPLLFGATAAVCALCAFAASILLEDDRRHPREKSGDEGWSVLAVKDKRFRRLCALNALLAVAMAQLVVPLSLYATNFLSLNEAQIGLVLSLNGALIVLLQVPATHLLTGAPLSAALAGGAAMYAFGYAWVGRSLGLEGLLGAVALVSLGEITVPAAVHALSANMAPERLRGRYMGMLGLSRQLGSAIGPVAGCASLQLAVGRSPALHWYAVSAIAALSALGFFLLGKDLKPSEQGITEPALADEGLDQSTPGA